jgi:L-amino acid N-acyltransferase YncA
MITIREFHPDDLEPVTRIYARHVLHGTATFDETAPSVEEMGRKYQKVRGFGLPWLIADVDGATVGYAYADRFRERSAYRFTLEDSIYIDPTHHRRGAGRALLKELLARCEKLGYRQMIAVIGDSANQASVGVHRAVGFEDIGTYKAVGFKFGRWLDTVLMQKMLGPGASSLPSDREDTSGLPKHQPL